MEKTCAITVCSFHSARSVPKIVAKQKKALECAQVLEKQGDKI